jgi:hypothetical protein
MGDAQQRVEWYVITCSRIFASSDESPTAGTAGVPDKGAAIAAEAGFEWDGFCCCRCARRPQSWRLISQGLNGRVFDSSLGL